VVNTISLANAGGTAIVNEREQFGKRLEALLIERNLTHRKVAEDIGCTGVTIGCWIRGSVPYSIMFLAELHRKYGVDLNELICGSEGAINEDNC